MRSHSIRDSRVAHTIKPRIRRRESYYRIWNACRHSRIHDLTGKGKIPSNWRNFPRKSDNKAELFNFLADKIARVATPNVVTVTKEEDAVSNHTISLAGMVPCSHEETDTRIFVHARYATEAGSIVIMVKASGTDVVIAVSVLQVLQELGLQQLWVAFGQGQDLEVDSCT